MPPNEPQDGIIALDQQINKLFAASATPPRPSMGRDTTIPRSSNAPLDPLTVRNVLRSVMNSDVQVTVLDIIVSATECEVLYAVDRAFNSPRNDRLILQMSQCLSPANAQLKMLQHLGHYQRDLTDLTTPANLGSNSLLIGDSILWVRDTIYASAFLDPIDTGTDEPDVEPDDEEPAPVPNPLILQVAKTMDDHLAEHSVIPASQRVPHIALQTADPMTVKAGTPFTVKLSNPNDLSEVKPSTADDTSLVVPIQNGTDTGEFNFFAIRPGTTKVTVIVAHNTSLAVASLTVDVIIKK